MSIIVGSARIDENGKLNSGAAGDQTKQEVATQDFYMHSKGWYVLRPKSIEVANKIAEAMSQACANDNIGYDQWNRNGAFNCVKKYGSMKVIAEKTEADCSALVRACIWQATGKDVGNFWTATQPDVLESSGLFEKRKVVNSSSEVYNGDVLVTKTTGHTVVVVSGRPRKVVQATAPAPKPSTPTTVVATMYADYKDKSLSGKYKTTTGLNMRNGAGTTHSIMTVLPKGTECTCYGYYSLFNGTKWYYVIAYVNGVKYTGFVSSKYLVQ